MIHRCILLFLLLAFEVSSGFQLFDRLTSFLSSSADNATLPPQLTPFVVNGKNAETDRWPYYTAIYIDLYGSNLVLYCGGTLVNKNWVLSAAHCVVDNYTYKLELHTPKTGKGGTKRITRDANPNRICKHPKWNSDTLDYDFALFRIDSVDDVEPVKLEESPSNSLQKLNIIGLGSIDPYGYENSMVLQEGEVEYVAGAECSDHWGKNLGEEQICATGKGEVDVCKGDSGGPLIRRGSDHLSDVQVGVVSYGYMPCNTKAAPPSVYGRISSVQSWVNDVILNGC